MEGNPNLLIVPSSNNWVMIFVNQEKSLTFRSPTAMKLFVDLLSNPPLFLIALQQGRFFMETRLDPEIQDPTGEERAVIENPDFEDPGFTTDEIIAWFQAVTAVSVGGATARPVLDTVGNLVHLCQAILEAWELSPIKVI
ncbi:SubName: Full=Uncharacterized protein {ECO:0000313/EMBL:CCA68578.1} [Serendipita indica DSM 11827]|nr:SubName: Full=Uncharacterized protein {ECO:0000313/EMBL:CCA68578.1} [Serendipita indica DSM 11827]